MNKKTYFIKGIPCASCEIIISEKLKGNYAFTLQNQTITFAQNAPSPQKLNHLFQKEGYQFSETPTKNYSWFESIILAFLLVIIFFFINKLGLNSLFNVTSKTALPGFFLFGLLAGISTCAALTGGILISLSKNWQTNTPYIQFTIGRLISYTFLGLVFGYLGQTFQFSPTLNLVLIVLISAFMLLNGLQMLGFSKLNISLPKLAINQKTPLIFGLLTFLLPCGFTITVESLSLLSGNPLNGAIIMFLFALGTLPGLMLLPLASLKFNFNKALGIILIFFALYNLNTQFAFTAKTSTPIVSNDKQIISMEASSFGYKPNYIKIPAGKSIVWQIKDTGTSGCTNAIIAPTLFEGRIPLTPGQTSIKEFVAPSELGKYRFSCWMGMVRGYFEVI